MGVEKSKSHSRQAAKGSSKKPAKSYGGFQFINVTPTKSDEKQAREAFEAGELNVNQVWEWCENGYDFKCSWDAANSCHKAQFSDMREDSETYKHCFSMRGSTATSATLKALFFMEYRHAQVWQALGEPETPESDWF